MKFLVLLSLLIVGCGNVGGRAGASRIVVFGDSIAESKSPLSYTYQIGAELNLPVVNEAKPGTTIEAKNQHPLIMSYAFGSNDLVFYTPGINDLYYNGTDQLWLAKYKALLLECLVKISNSGAQAYVGTTAKTLHPLFTDDRVAIYAEILRSIVRENNLPGIHLVDVNAEFKPNASNMKDEVHPNELGQSQLKEIFLNSF